MSMSVLTTFASRVALGAGIGATAGALNHEKDPYGQNYNGLRAMAQGAVVGGLAGGVLGGSARVIPSYAKGFDKGAAKTSRDVVDSFTGGLKDPKGASAKGGQLGEALQKGGVRGSMEMLGEGLGYMGGVAPAALRAPFTGAHRGINKMMSAKAGKEVSKEETSKAIGKVGVQVAGFGLLGVGVLTPSVGLSHMRGVKNKRADASMQYNQQQMAMADAVIIKNPNMAGMRDVDNAYDYQPGNRSSAMPLTGKQAQQHQQTMRRSQRRMRPGMYADGGDLVFAMHDLRRS